ncbi:MAG: glutamate-5-semialdehyde dehydrogenase [Candidatus Omnitrophica bacterium]|nr:glutamate-5-semialdehyde dehydrogenase [Candidatus Omnitrophota bacterium]
MIASLAKKSRNAAFTVAGLSADRKNAALLSASAALLDNAAFIINENKKDLKRLKKTEQSGAFINRLTVNQAQINNMSDSLKAIAQLADPVGQVIKEWSAPSGFWIKKVRVPIGVIAIIYESRPDVTSDCIGLCLKSGNCVILRGGSEAINSNKAIYKVLAESLRKSEIPDGAVNLVQTTSRQEVRGLLKLNEYIDLVIPRGGEGLIKQVTELSRIPVIKHYRGICHVYVDKDADLSMAKDVCFNAKVQRPGTCNAMETMLVHRDIAAKFLPAMLEVFKKAGVRIRGCSLTRKIVKAGVQAAKEKDYQTEYLDLILSVRVVKDLREAINHINLYSSHHSDSIVTANDAAAAQFLREVDSACVYHNASTRLTDGFQFGMGAEMGISTDKLHARGPMALEELTTYKYVIYGKGHLRK